MISARPVRANSCNICQRAVHGFGMDSAAGGHLLMLRSLTPSMIRFIYTGPECQRHVEWS